MQGFLFVQLCQLLFLSGSMIFTASFIADGSQELNIAHAFQKNLTSIEAISIEFGVFFSSCIFLRLLLYSKNTLLLLCSMIFYTICGAILVCHISSMIVCHENEEQCLASSTQTFRGRNAVYLSAALLILPIFVNYYIDVTYSSSPSSETMNDEGKNISFIAIISNSIIVIFVAICTICIIDDAVWDWRYAYAILFTLAITTYISGISSYILFEDHHNKSTLFLLEKTTRDALQIEALVILQPLLFVEASVRICMAP